MNPAILAVSAIFLSASGAAFARSDTLAPFELERIVVTPENGGTIITTLDSNDLKIGESQTVVTASGAVVSLLKTEYGVEIYVDGNLLGISEHLAIP
jgi:hypothetical protein